MKHIYVDEAASRLLEARGKRKGKRKASAPSNRSKASAS